MSIAVQLSSGSLAPAAAPRSDHPAEATFPALMQSLGEIPEAKAKPGQGDGAGDISISVDLEGDAGTFLSAPLSRTSGPINTSGARKTKLRESDEEKLSVQDAQAAADASALAAFAAMAIAVPVDPTEIATNLAGSSTDSKTSSDAGGSVVTEGGVAKELALSVAMSPGSAAGRPTLIVPTSGVPLESSRSAPAELKLIAPGWDGRIDVATTTPVVAKHAITNGTGPALPSARAVEAPKTSGTDATAPAPQQGLISPLKLDPLTQSKLWSGVGTEAEAVLAPAPETEVSTQPAGSFERPIAVQRETTIGTEAGSAQRAVDRPDPLPDARQVAQPVAQFPIAAGLVKLTAASTTPRVIAANGSGANESLAANDADRTGSGVSAALDDSGQSDTTTGTRVITTSEEIAGTSTDNWAAPIPGMGPSATSVAAYAVPDLQATDAQRPPTALAPQMRQDSSTPKQQPEAPASAPSVALATAPLQNASPLRFVAKPSRSAASVETSALAKPARRAASAERSAPTKPGPANTEATPLPMAPRAEEKEVAPEQSSSASPKQHAESPREVESNPPLPSAPTRDATAATAQASVVAVPKSTTDGALPASMPPASQAATAAVESAHEAKAFTLVQSARLIERAASAEMRVGVQTLELGKVEVHASLRDNGVGATLSVDRPDIQRMFAAELPNLNRALDRHHVELQTVSLLSSTNDGTGGQGRGQQPAPQRQVWPQDNETVFGPQSARLSSSAVAAVAASGWKEGRVDLLA